MHLLKRPVCAERRSANKLRRLLLQGLGPNVQERLRKQLQQQSAIDAVQPPPGTAVVSGGVLPVLLRALLQRPGEQNQNNGEHDIDASAGQNPELGTPAEFPQKNELHQRV